MVVLKKIFNSLFSEDCKEKIRNKLSKVFLYIDKKVYYREYAKACKYILKKRIFENKDDSYAYRDESIFNKIKLDYIQTRIDTENFDAYPQDMQECVAYTRENGLNIYCGALENLQGLELKVELDEKNKLYYGYYCGKKLYFKDTVDTPEKAKQELRGLLAEQSEKSPHQYLSGDFQVDEGGIVLDIGCADGNFALSIIDQVGHVYLFEMEEEWMRPLELTFAPYKDKVTLIKKCVTKTSGDISVSIDDFCKTNHIDHINMIKMDVEGYELDVLEGAKDSIRNHKIQKAAVCTYHRLEDEKNIANVLSNYNIHMQRGYMLGSMIYDIWDIKRPYFVKGIMQATLKNS